MPPRPATAYSTRVASLLLSLAFLAGPGCDRPPQVSTSNREIIVSLATAVSTRNQAWLDSNDRLVELRHSEGILSEAEYQTFREIIATARAGDWATAERDVYRLRESQRPTAEDRERVTKRQLGDELGREAP